MEDTIKELTQIRNDLLFAVEYRDGLLVKFQANKIDSLIYRLSKKLNVEKNDRREEGEIKP